MATAGTNVCRLAKSDSRSVHEPAAIGAVLANGAAIAIFATTVVAFSTLVILARPVPATISPPTCAFVNGGPLPAAVNVTLSPDVADGVMATPGAVGVG